VSRKRRSPKGKAHVEERAGSTRTKRRSPRLARILGDARLPIAVFIVTRGAYVLDVSSSDPILRDFYTLDSERYLAAAQSIVSGATLSEPFHFAPLYAYFLAIFSLLGLGIWAVYLVQLALGALSVWFVFRLGRACFGRTSGVLAATLFTLYGAASMLELKIMETTLATTLLTSAVFYALPSQASQRRRLLSGVLLGLACLARPNVLLFVPFVLLWAFTNGSWTFRHVRRRLPRVLPLAAGVLAVLFAMGARNRIQSGEWILISSQGGVAFSQGNNAAADGGYGREQGFSGRPLEQAKEARQIAETAEGRALTVSEVDSYWYGRGVSYLTSDVTGALALWAKKFRAWLGSDELSLEYVFRADRSLFPSLWLVSLPFAVIVAAAVLTLKRASWLGKSALLLGVVLTNVLSILIFFFASRYRVPAVPVLCVLAGAGIHRLIRGVPRRQIAASLGVLVFSLISWSDRYDVEAAAYEGLLGRAYLQAGRTREAISHLEHASAGHPGSWSIRHNLGEAYGVAKRYREAVHELTLAERIDPRAPSTQRALEHYRARLAETVTPGD
jgi:4-amino-4-deoxy-L-arabinose transferase-like glycosyltransferase